MTLAESIYGTDKNDILSLTYTLMLYQTHEQFANRQGFVLSSIIEGR